MQAFGPRISVPQGNTYTAQQIQTALFSAAATMRFSYSRLDPNGKFLGDLSDSVGGDATLDHDTSKKAPRTLTLSVRGDSGLQPNQELLRLRLLLQMADNDYVPFDLATLLVLPNQERRSSSGKWLDLQAVDLVQALIDAEFTQSYSVSVGTDFGVAISALLSGYGGLFPLPLMMSNPGKTIPVPLVWEAGKNHFDAINDLLTAIAYMPLWFDEMGRARSAPLPDYSTAPPSFTYDLGANDALGDAVTVKGDPSKAYKTVEVLVEDPNRDPFVAGYTYPGNSPVVPYWRPKTLVIRDSTLADQTAAAAYAKSQQQESMRAAAGTYTLSSLPWPLSQHLDVYSAVQFNADDGATFERFVEMRWRLIAKTTGVSMERDWAPIS